MKTKQKRQRQNEKRKGVEQNSNPAPCQKLYEHKVHVLKTTDKLFLSVFKVICWEKFFLAKILTCLAWWQGMWGRTLSLSLSLYVTQRRTHSGYAFFVWYVGVEAKRWRSKTCFTTKFKKRVLPLPIFKPSVGRREICPRLAEAVNDCCACSVFNYIPDLHGRETRVAVAGKWLLLTFMADRDSCKIRNVWSAPEEKQILLICSELEIPGQLDVCVNSASVSSPILILNLRLL